MSNEEEVLKYHSQWPRGKIEINPTKPCITSRDLSLAYSPGVAVPCVHIAKNPNDVYKYTAKGNLVGVVSNGTAVLGLGNIGPLAAKPVMEGKGVLFKKFADIDVFDIELNTTSKEEVVQACKFLEPTFGGINLEDIKAPECFYIEEQLRKTLSIPVFHDDQHGTAVIAGAAFINAVEITGKDIKKMRAVFSGAGAAAIACAGILVSLGLKKENIILCDSKGVVYKGRGEGMNPYKERFAVDTKLRTLEEAMKGADAFLGVSAAGLLSDQMVKSMAKKPIIFAMANPEPEILPSRAKKVRSDVIIATGRSDFPNQVNNVLCFPFIFRGALDVYAKSINEEMKLAAVHALAKLAKEPVPELIASIYGGHHFSFGPEYLIPKPFDPRVLLWVAPAVAKAAMDSGVAREPIENIEEYKEKLEQRMGNNFMVAMRSLRNTVRKRTAERKVAPKIVFPEGDSETILRACRIVKEEGIATPILLGDEKHIRGLIEEYKLTRLRDVTIIDPKKSEKAEHYARVFAKKRERKGMTFVTAEKSLKRRNYFGPMMVEVGDADGVINGISQSYPEAIRPMVTTIGAKPGHRLAGIYIMNCKSRILFFADTTVNIDISARELAGIALETSKIARNFLQTEPRVAMLSFSNFGSAPSAETRKVREAMEYLRELDPELIVDGEMQVDTAISPDVASRIFPFSKIQGNANVLIFPNLASANISYKLLLRLGGAESIGPILIGMNKPVNVLQRVSTVQDVVNMTTITAMRVHIADTVKNEKRSHTNS